MSVTGGELVRLNARLVINFWAWGGGRVAGPDHVWLGCGVYTILAPSFGYLPK